MDLGSNIVGMDVQDILSHINFFVKVIVLPECDKHGIKAVLEYAWITNFHEFKTH